MQVGNTLPAALIHTQEGPLTHGSEMSPNTLLSHASPSPGSEIAVLSKQAPSHVSGIPTTMSSLPPNQAPEEMLALEALGQLKSGVSPPPLDTPPSQTAPQERPQSTEKPDSTTAVTDNQKEDFFDTSTDSESVHSRPSSSSLTSRERLYRKMRNNPIVASAVEAYKQNKPAIKYGVEMVERATLPMVNIIEEKRLEWKRKRRLSKANAMFPDDAKVDLSRSSSLSSFSLHSSKRQKLPSIAEALSMSNMNWNELSVNMSIESKKRLQTCLQLLMLANKQLTSKVEHLQEVIAKEQELLDKKREEQRAVDGENEVFHDAIEDVDTNNHSAEIKHEIVGTIKKVVTFISKYAGNSLPEPARTDVREELLRLPTKWSSQASSNSMFGRTTNAKVLVLANESLDMVRSVMSVFDETLTKAEFWVKQKQEKQLAKQAILNNSLKRTTPPTSFEASVDAESGASISGTATEAASEVDPRDKSVIE